MWAVGGSVRPSEGVARRRGGASQKGKSCLLGSEPRDGLPRLPARVRGGRPLRAVLPGFTLCLGDITGPYVAVIISP